MDISQIKSSWRGCKTNWSPTDYFEYTDYDRINENLQVVSLCIDKIDNGTYESIEQYIDIFNIVLTYSSIPNAREFNAIESFIDTIKHQLSQYFTKSFAQRSYFYDNQPTFDYKWLNRIEGIIEMLYNNLLGSISSMPTLSFILNGGDF